jgi:uncharacterized protein with GYD domain
MATYIILGQFTEQGIKNVKDTPDELRRSRIWRKKFNATVTALYWTLGRFDVAVDGGTMFFAGRYTVVMPYVSAS